MEKAKIQFISIKFQLGDKAGLCLRAKGVKLDFFGNFFRLREARECQRSLLDVEIGVGTIMVIWR